MARSDMSYSCISAAVSKKREHIGHWTSPTIDHLKYARLGNLKIMMSKYVFQTLGDFFFKFSKYT